MFVGLLLYSVFYKKWGISTYIISVYLLTLVVSLLIESIFANYTDNKNASIIYATALFLFFQPYLRKTPIIKPLTNPYLISRVAICVNIISWLLIVLSILIIPAVFQSLRVGANDIRMGYYTYHGNFITSFAIHYIDILSPISYSLLTISFYMIAFIQGYDREKKLSFIASLAAPYYGILVGGRTQMIYWLLSLLFNYVLFYRYFPKVKRKQLFKYSSIVVAIILVYIGYATINRFSSSDWGTNDSLLIYMGQSYPNFCYFYENFPKISSITLSRIFPLTDSFINGLFNINSYRDTLYLASGMDIGVFYTLLGDLFVDIGVKGIYIYAIFYLIITNIILNKKQLDIGDILIVGILFLIPLQGVFYYSFWKRQVTLCALVVVIFTRFIKEKKA